MGIIVEDGTSKTNSESYCSVADADKHHAGRGRSTWADLDTADKEIHLRLATDYMLQTYRGQWQGIKTKADQALDWPRSNVFLAENEQTPINSIPREVRQACAELAFRSLSGPLIKDLSEIVKKVQIGPITKEFDTTAPRYKVYEAVDRMLQPFFGEGTAVAGSSLKIGRC